MTLPRDALDRANLQQGSLDRARAGLLGMAIGDALGMPSQTLSRAEIARHYGRIVDVVAPFDGHPVAHGLKAGQITDDTEQTLLLARRRLSTTASVPPCRPRGWASVWATRSARRMWRIALPARWT